MSNQVRRTVLPFLRLGGYNGWQPLLKMTALDPAGTGLRLGVPGSRPIPLGEPLGSFGGQTLIRGTAISPEGELLLADPQRRSIRIHRQPVAGAAPPAADFVDLWPPRPLPVREPGALREPPHPPADPYTLVEPVDLAFTPAGDLLIVDAGAGRLLVLAWPNATLRAVISLPGWRPVAVACDARGRSYVADAAAARIHRFDRRWRPEAHYPHPATELSAPWQLGVVLPACQTPGPGCSDCSGCTAPPQPAPVVAVLDGTTVRLLDERGRLLPADTPLPALQPPALQRDANGELSWQDPRYPGRQPLQLSGLRVDRRGIHPDSTLALLAMGRKVRLPQAGQLRLGPLHGDSPGFAWDRLVLDAQIPAGTEILVSTLATDNMLEPGQVASSGVGWSQPVTLHTAAPTELLVPGRGGQYLWLDLELRGTGTLSPILRRIDVHAPRQSSLQLLPPGYRQEPDSADFLDRFLSYFDTVFAEIEATHRNVFELLDARTVPAGAALDWLGSWFGLHFEPQWDTATRRQVITEAMSYATERGTVPGIKRLLRWHTALPEPWPAVIEHFRIPADTQQRIGGSQLPEPGQPHRVTIVLPAAVAPDLQAREHISDLLARHLPAHVLVRVRYIEPGMVLGVQSTLSVDTLVAGAPAGRLGTARLGIDTTTAASAPKRRTPIAPARSTSC